MMAVKCEDLGRVATEILNATFADSDYRVEGDCNVAIARAQFREYNQIARNNGFKNFYELLAEIEERTSPRWVHFHFPYMGGDPDSDN